MLKMLLPPLNLSIAEVSRHEEELDLRFGLKGVAKQLRLALRVEIKGRDKINQVVSRRASKRVSASHTSPSLTAIGPECKKTSDRVFYIDARRPH